MYPVDKKDGTQEIEQRVQWSAPAWASYYALYSISYVPSSLSTGYYNATFVLMSMGGLNQRDVSPCSILIMWSKQKVV